MASAMSTVDCTAGQPRISGEATKAFFDGGFTLAEAFQVLACRRSTSTSRHGERCYRSASEVGHPS